VERPSVDLLKRLGAARGLAMRPCPVSGWFTASDGLQLHYLDWPGGPETLVLLHGGALSAHTFDLLALALTEQVRCIALDLRGHGLSGWGEAYSIERGAADVVELADRLGVPRLHLAGMSLGGCVAGHAAVGLGARLASLAFIDVGPRVNFSATANLRRFMAEVDATAPLEDVVRTALAASPRTDPDLLLYRYQGLLRPQGGWRADRRRATDYAHILGRLAELCAIAPRIACPTLAIKGGRSRVLTVDDLRAFAARFPRGLWALVPDAGHNVQEDQPAALAAELRNLIQPRSLP
jgi:pimeloyl-ACP methyl ester carboxylesterase